MTQSGPQTIDELEGFLEHVDEVDVDEFGRIVREASDADLRTATTEHRETILDEIFRQMPERVRHDRIEGVDALLRWRLTGRADGGEDVYEITIRDGTCSMHKGDTGAPARTTLIVDPVSFVKLMAQATGPMKLVLRRRMRVRGDVAFAMRSESFFRKPLDDD